MTAMGADLAIHGATLVSPARRWRASVYVKDGRIEDISDIRRQAATEIDARGLYLLPGAIDGHVHFMDPAETDREDFMTGSAAAASGGVTTVVEHTHAAPVRDAADFERKAVHLRARSLVDFGLAAHIWPDRIERLHEVWGAGAVYLKAFTCTTHGVPGLTNAQMLRALQAAADMRAVVLVHCEDETITGDAETELRAAGCSGGDILGRWRSREAELVAVNSVGMMARISGARTVVAHASHAGIADLAQQHRTQGADLWVETCPQYLYLYEDEAFEREAFRKFTPPARVRSRWESEALWRRVAAGPVTHVSSDHAPSTAEHKRKGVWDAPFGLPGTETLLPMLLEGVHRGFLSVERVVELVSEAPARLYGFFPRKGALRPGADADLVLVDPAAKTLVDDRAIVSKAGWSPFAGVELHGRPVRTFCRGRLIAEDGRPVGEPGWGRLLLGAGAARSAD